MNRFTSPGHEETRSEKQKGMACLHILTFEKKMIITFFDLQIYRCKLIFQDLTKERKIVQ